MSEVATINGIDIADIAKLSGKDVGDVASINAGIEIPSGGIAIVQSAAGTTADGSSGLTVSFGVPVTAGNSVIAFISFDSAGGFDEQPTLFGDGSEQVSNVVNTLGTGLKVYLNAIHNVVGGETYVNFTLDAAVRASMQIIEVSGLADAAAEDTNTRASSGSTMNFNLVEPASANNLIVGIGAYANATQDYSSGPTSPFTRLGTGTGGASVWQEVVWAIQSAADSQGSNMDITMWHDYATANAAFGGA